jgi:hypothetical protein
VLSPLTMFACAVDLRRRRGFDPLSQHQEKKARFAAGFSLVSRPPLVDIHQMRSLVPKIETYRSEIASQVRRALAPEADVDTPLSVHFPSLVVSHS